METHAGDVQSRLAALENRTQGSNPLIDAGCIRALTKELISYQKGKVHIKIGRNDVLNHNNDLDE